jgi:hypothetical protein
MAADNTVLLVGAAVGLATLAGVIYLISPKSHPAIPGVNVPGSDVYGPGYTQFNQPSSTTPTTSTTPGA